MENDFYVKNRSRRGLSSYTPFTSTRAFVEIRTNNEKKHRKKKVKNKNRGVNVYRELLTLHFETVSIFSIFY